MTGDLLQNPWTRSPNGWLAGVCQGVGERFDIKPNVIRIIWFLSVFFIGAGLVFYIICALCLPVQGREEYARQPKLLGVCYRLSEKLNVDVGLLRIVTVLIGLGSLGTTALAYIVIHFLLGSSTNHDRSIN